MTIGLFTITVRISDIVMFPAVSVARACSMWMALASAAVFQEVENGAAVSEPSTTPSARTSTCETPLASLALTAIETVPATVALSAGAAIATSGPLVSVPSTGYSAMMP
jgi:hypothetical protein